MKVNVIRNFAYVAILAVLVGCKDNGSCPVEESVKFPRFNEQIIGFNYPDRFNNAIAGNTVTGHDERDTIVGNFTGLGIDTLYVVKNFTLTSDVEESLKNITFYARSNNPDIPDVELDGCWECDPQLVYEGDLDGDLKDEWGYLPTWMMSQWRYYHVFNYNSQNKCWRYLYYDAGFGELNLLDTSEWIRSCNVDIVEKGPVAGSIRIHFDRILPLMGHWICDTIVTPTYTPILLED